MIRGTYESERLINIKGIDKNHLESDCVNGSILNGVSQPILYSFALDKPPCHKLYNQPTITFLKR